jgi:histidine ammonia-lyase
VSPPRPRVANTTPTKTNSVRVGARTTTAAIVRALRLPGVKYTPASMAKRARARTSDHLVVLGIGAVSIDDVARVARAGARVELDGPARASVARSRRVVDRAVGSGEAYYGLNTGFGSLAKERISERDVATLQRNLVRSHAAGVGEALPVEVVRAMMVILAGSLARGLSGVRVEVVEGLVAMLNSGVTPVVPSVGSVGASGDLAPLAHVALVLIGEGEATVGGRRMSGAAALRAAGLTALELRAKEGLALINGTHLMSAQGALLSVDGAALWRASVVALAMSIDACRATHALLDARLYRARRHAESALTAKLLRDLLGSSAIATSHIENDPRVQDPYSLRAGPTILGAVRRELDHLRATIAGELGAVTDNPLVFASARGGAIVSGANFHGMPLAIPLDGLAMALAHIAGPSERRAYLMTGAFEPQSQLKPFLAPSPGLQSGMMIAQYTAAACVNELVGLATPASVANVSTCAGMEDYNSFGPRSAAKARRGVTLATSVVAIEMMIAAQGLECHRPLRSGRGVERAYDLIRTKVATLTEDRTLTRDIEAIASMISDGAFDAVVV